MSFLLCLTGSSFLFGQSHRDTLLSIGKFAVHFDYNASVLPDSHALSLQLLVDSLSKYKEKIFILSAHTSQSGSAAYNQQLSEKRLEHVRKLLIEKGIDSTRIEGLAFGKEKPIVKGKKEEDQAVNRRVEIEVKRKFLLTQLNGSIQVDSGAFANAVWIKGSNRFFQDSVLSQTDGKFSMWVPDFLPITLSTFVPGYAADVVNFLVDSKKKNTTVVIPMIALRPGKPIYFHSVQFYGNKNIILPKSMEALENLGIQLLKNHSYCFELQGHVNAPGVPASMAWQYMDLSKARAGRVYEWLKNKGMQPERILPAGYGHLKMLYPNAHEESLQQKNRRVEVHVLDCTELAKRRMEFNEEEYLQLTALPLYSDFRGSEQVRQ